MTLPLNGLSGHEWERDFERHAHAHVRQIRLIDVRVAPHLREVGDGHDHFAGRQVVAGADVALDDHTAHGRIERQVFLHVARSLNLIDLLFGNIPELQPSPGRGHEIRGAFARVGIAARGQLLVGFQCRDVLALRRQEVRAVERQERLALLDALPGDRDEEFVDPAVDLHGDVVQPGFVGHDARRGVNFAREQTLLHRAQLETHGLP